MPGPNQSHYTVKVVFRGLFLAIIHESDAPQGAAPNGFVEVLLPDASSPAHTIAKSQEPLRTLLSSLQPLREHHGILEFPLSEWENQSTATPGVFQVVKPTKEPVGMFFLKRYNIRFRGLWSRDGVPPESLTEEMQHYSNLADGLLILRNHDSHGYNQLAGLGADPISDSEAMDNAITARTTLRFGEIFTERRSRARSAERQWEHLTSDQIGNPPTHANARPINLDLVLRFDLPITNPLLVVCEPLDPGLEVRQFVLRPSQPERGVTVWVKNRELDATLADSDLLEDSFGISCPDLDGVDRDHALFMLLTTNPSAVLLPRDLNDDAADCGSGCGGCGHPR